MLGPKMGGGGGRRGLSSPSNHILIHSIITLALPTTSAAASTAAGASPAPSPLASCPSLSAFAPLAPPAWCPRVLASPDSFVSAIAPSARASTTNPLAPPSGMLWANTNDIISHTLLPPSAAELLRQDVLAFSFRQKTLGSPPTLPAGPRGHLDRRVPQPQAALPILAITTATAACVAYRHRASSLRRRHAASIIQALVRACLVRRAVHTLRVLCACPAAASHGIDILQGFPDPCLDLARRAGAYHVGSRRGTSRVHTAIGWYSASTDLYFSVERHSPFHLAVRERGCDGEQGTDVTPTALVDTVLTLQAAVRGWLLRRCLLDADALGTALAHSSCTGVSRSDLVLEPVVGDASWIYTVRGRSQEVADRLRGLSDADMHVLSDVGRAAEAFVDGLQGAATRLPLPGLPPAPQRGASSARQRGVCERAVARAERDARVRRRGIEATARRTRVAAVPIRGAGRDLYFRVGRPSARAAMEEALDAFFGMSDDGGGDASAGLMNTSDLDPEDDFDPASYPDVDDDSDDDVTAGAA